MFAYSTYEYTMQTPTQASVCIHCISSVWDITTRGESGNGVVGSMLSA